jgi:hypothetical protein
MKFRVVLVNLYDVFRRMIVGSITLLLPRDNYRTSFVSIIKNLLFMATAFTGSRKSRTAASDDCSPERRDIVEANTQKRKTKGTKTSSGLQCLLLIRSACY